MASEQEAAAIELRDVQKRFGSQTVLNGVSLEVHQGETLVVLGRSGTGKSVLLKVLIGLVAPDAGSVRIHGKEMTGVSDADANVLRARMGFLFQDAALYDSLSVEDNVAFPLRHQPPARRADAGPAPDNDHRVEELLNFVGMADAKHKMPSEISGGMKKRVGLARALALQPDILLFDEPTAGLDPITAGEIDTLIVNLRREHDVASVVVTHDVHSARKIADRVTLLHEGALVINGTFDDLRRSTDPLISQFLQEAL